VGLLVEHQSHRLEDDRKSVSVYILTGKLGGGKTLCAVHKINEALREGRRVATNLDLHLRRLPSVGRDNRRARVVRLPDRPTSSDIDSLGYGVSGVRNDAEAKSAYDETKFGLLVLDECGTWLNAREWQDSDRRALLDLLLHIRKKLWHVFLIIQDVSMLDKQVRKAIAEHVVYCRNLSNFTVPGVSAISKLFTDKPVKLPRAHVAMVKYGDQQHSITVDRWWYNGADLFGAYDTTQVFRQDYEHGLFSVLPPAYLRWVPRARRSWSFVMRLTRIYFKKSPKLLVAGWAMLFGAAVAWFAAGRSVGAVTPTAVARNAAIVAPAPVRNLDSFWVVSFSELALDGHAATSYSLTDGKVGIDSTTLALQGVDVHPLGPCRVALTEAGVLHVVSCRPDLLTDKPMPTLDGV